MRAFLSGFLFLVGLSMISNPAQAEIQVVSCENAAIKVTFDPTTASLEVLDKRTNKIWRQSGAVCSTKVWSSQSIPNGLTYSFTDIATKIDIKAKVLLDEAKPEFSLWERDKKRFAKSFKAVLPLVRKVGYAQMDSHDWLTDDHSVQQTQFSNGVTVTVNFGDIPYAYGNQSIAPLGHFIERM